MSNYLNFTSIKNFRIFDKLTQFNFAPITFLVGPNNSGKSSLLKILTLLRESTKQENGLEILNFNTSGHFLGHFDNTLNHVSKSKIIRIELPFYMDTLDMDLVIVLEYGNHGENGLLNYLCVKSERDVFFEITYFKDDKKCNLKCDLDLIRNSLHTNSIIDQLDPIVDWQDWMEAPRFNRGDDESDIPKPLQKHLTSIFDSFWHSNDYLFNKVPPKETTKIPAYFETEIGHQDEINQAITTRFKTKGLDYTFKILPDGEKYNQLNSWQNLNYYIKNYPIFDSLLNSLNIYFENYKGTTALGEYIFNEVIITSFNRGIKVLENKLQKLYSISSVLRCF